MMENNSQEKILRVANILMSGKLPFSRKINHNEMNKLIETGNWFLINEEISPMLQKRIESQELNVRGKKKNICVLLWTNGVISISGIKKKKQGEELYQSVLSELGEYIPKILEDFNLHLDSKNSKISKKQPALPEM